MSQGESASEESSSFDDEDFSDMPGLEQVDVQAQRQEMAAELAIDFRDLPMGTLEDGAEPDYAHAAELKSRALEEAREGHLRKAVLLASDAVQAHPGSGLMLVCRARILIDLGEISAAKRDLKLAVKRSPNSASAYHCLGDACRLLCDSEGAVKAYRTGLDLEYRAESARHLTVMEKDVKEQARRDRAVREKVKVDIKPGKPSSAIPGVHPAAQGFKPPAGMANPFEVLADEAANLSPQMAERLMGDNKVASLFNDPDFAAKLAEASNGPEGAAKFANDPEFLKNIAAFMGVMGQKK
ncbi:hypothetical protein KIPB_001539 [Kipferlia bialata]|uniref:STI1/HOP DP domain-containing protein n=1 Tax=Kipferlia bialata TaxID=797122 RepID=A0A9K3CP18_9EUKA|nr:hypothetical protein KIPB_001539 [Kipferlia bialata]|eukprot:g1539.t1